MSRDGDYVSIEGETSAEGKYTGDLNGDRLPHGKGKMIDLDGTTFDGRWVNGKPSWGTLCDTNGVVSIGPFKDGLLCSRTNNLIEGETGECIRVDADGGVFRGKIFGEDSDGIYSIVYSNEFSTGFSEYNGKLKNGRYHDTDGLLIIENKYIKTSYRGIFVNGHFVHGRIEYSNGNVYEGPVYFQKPNTNMYKDLVIKRNKSSTEYKYNNTSITVTYETVDKGTLTRANGDTYKGEFLNGMFNGRGVYKVGKLIKDGLFKNNVFISGNVTDKETNEFMYIQFDDGSQFTGSLKDGKPNGEGTKTSNNCKSIGFWKNGELYNGDKTEIFDRHTIVSTYSEGKYNTKIIFKECVTLNLDNKSLYSEVFESGDSESLYTGGVKNGMRHGTGTMTYSNGCVFEGDWKDNRRVCGKLELPNSKTSLGPWIVRFDENHELIECTWAKESGRKRSNEEMQIV